MTNGWCRSSTVSRRRPLPPTLTRRCSSSTICCGRCSKADRKVLEENFRVDFKDPGEGRWSLVLTPVTTPLDKIFSTLDLKGAIYLEYIRLNDKQGDTTDIALSRHQLTPARLTDAERQRFAAP